MNKLEFGRQEENEIQMNAWAKTVDLRKKLSWLNFNRFFAKLIYKNQDR